MLNRIYTLTLNVVLLVVLRSVGTLMLDRYWASSLKRLALRAVEGAALGSAVWFSSALAALAAALYALLDRELGISVSVAHTRATASQLDDRTRKQLQALGCME